MLFMQTAPAIVFGFAAAFGLVMLICFVLMIVKGDNAGYFHICLVLAGYATVLGFFKQAKKLTGKSIFTLMSESEDYWKTHDK